MVGVKVAKPKPKVIKPYKKDDIKKVLAVCDYDYESNAKLLGSRNRAIILVLLDTGIRLSELLGMNVGDIDIRNGNIMELNITYPFSKQSHASC